MFSFLRRKSKSTPQNAYSLKADDEALMALFRTLTNDVGIEMTPSLSLRVSCVYACVNVIARHCAVLPVTVRKKRADGGSDAVANLPLSYVLGVSSSHRTPAMSFLFSYFANLVFRGNGYALVLRDGNQQVNSLLTLDSAAVDYTQDPVTGIWRYEYLADDGTRAEIAPSNVFHTRGFGFTSAKGLDTYAASLDAVALAKALDRNAAKYFGNHSKMGTVLQTDGALRPDYRAELEKRLAEKHEGPDNAYRTLILENGLKLLAQRYDNTSSQFDESRRRQCEEVARYYGVPLNKLGIASNIPRANAEEANSEFVIGTITPLVKLFESHAVTQLLTPKQIGQGYYVKMNVNGLLRGNFRDRMSGYATGRQWGIYSVNEIREWEDLNPIGPDGDIYLQPSNMIDAGANPADAVDSKLDNNNAGAGNADGGRTTNNHYSFMRNSIDQL